MASHIDGVSAVLGTIAARMLRVQGQFDKFSASMKTALGGAAAVGLGAEIGKWALGIERAGEGIVHIKTMIGGRRFQRPSGLPPWPW